MQSEPALRIYYVALHTKRMANGVASFLIRFMLAVLVRTMYLLFVLEFILINLSVAER